MYVVRVELQKGNTNLLLVNEFHLSRFREIFLDMAREAVGRPPGIGEGEPRRRIAGVEDVNLLSVHRAAEHFVGLL